MAEDFDARVASHWFDGNAGTLLGRIDQALGEAGKSLEDLSRDDLKAFDEFHIRGLEATEELAGLTDIGAEHKLIDIGSGIGGPSRHLAATRGCEVSGVDLTSEYCEVATRLAERIGLAGKVSYRQANALALPFPDLSFDWAWTQHISMNIPDKTALFSEMYRVLKPGGAAAIYDPIAGNGEPLTFPLPWSRDGAISFLINSDETRALLETVGFRIEDWRDVSAPSLEWFDRGARAAGSKPQPLGLHLLLGPDWQMMAANMVANIRAGRLAVIQAVVRKPA